MRLHSWLQLARRQTRAQETRDLAAIQSSLRSGILERSIPVGRQRAHPASLPRGPGMWQGARIIPVSRRRGCLQGLCGPSSCSDFPASFGVELLGQDSYELWSLGDAVTSPLRGCISQLSQLHDLSSSKIPFPAIPEESSDFLNPTSQSEVSAIGLPSTLLFQPLVAGKSTK